MGAKRGAGCTGEKSDAMSLALVASGHLSFALPAANNGSKVVVEDVFDRTIECMT